MVSLSKLLLPGIFIVQLLWCSCYAQTHFLITFTDKDSSLSAPDYLSQAALQRRLLNDITPDASDLPVKQTYVEELTTAGATLKYTLKWFNAAVVMCDSATLAEIRSKEFVKNTEPLRGPVSFGAAGRTGNRVQEEEVLEGAFKNSLHILGINEMHRRGFTGQGIKVAVFDSGFEGVKTINAFKSLTINDVYDFVDMNTNVYAHDSHGTSVLSVIAAGDSFTAYAAVPDAEVYLYRTETVAEEWPLELANWAAAAERADSVGVQIINSSLSYTDFDAPEYDFTWADLSGNKSIISRAANIAAQKGILMVSSAGNYGNKSWRYIAMPADAEGIITVGAVTGNGEIASLSSIGPTTDGRLKPELVAPGSGVPVLGSTGNVSYTSGTSFSAPAVAGLAAGLMQAFPSEPISRIKSALFFSGNRYLAPDNEYGYGIPHFTRASNYLNGITNSLWLEEGLIYPNPATEARQATVTIPQKFKDKGALNWEVIDITGRSILKGTYTGKEDSFSIALQEKPPGGGMYFFRLAASGTASTVWRWIWL